MSFVQWNNFKLTKFHLFCFSYGYQQWSISFSRQEKSLGVYLVWRNPSDGMKVILVSNSCKCFSTFGSISNWHSKVLPLWMMSVFDLLYYFFYCCCKDEARWSSSVSFDFSPCFKDFSITLLNREHFTDNQTFAANRAKFTRDSTCKKSD